MQYIEIHLFKKNVSAYNLIKEREVFVKEITINASAIADTILLSSSVSAEASTSTFLLITYNNTYIP